MASKITIKRSLTAAAPAGLSFGEMALVQGSGLTANQLYVGISGGSPVWVGAQIGTTGTWTDTAAQTSLATQYAIEQRISAKISAQTAGVSSFNGLTGAVTGVGTAVAGTGISVSGATGAVTITNIGVQSFNGATGAVTGVSSFNGLTGAVGGVTTSVANTFTALQKFSAGISASGGTFASDITVNSMTVGLGGGGSYTNVAVGGLAFKQNIAGIQNVAVGYNALTGNTTGIQNVAVGHGALASNTTGSNNAAVGNSALGSNTTGSGNVGVGQSALNTNSSGIDNIAVGEYALNLNETGSDNIGVGKYAIRSNTTGINNVGVGRDALFNNTTGSNKTAIGYSSGSLRGTGFDALTTGTGGIYIGYQARGSTNGQTNEIVIGSNALALGSNTAVIGATSQTAATIYGLLNLPSGLSTTGATFTGNISAPNIVSSFNGVTGAVTGVGTAVAGTGISVSGATGAVTITNIGVQTFNGLTGAVTGLTSGGPLGTPSTGTLTNCTSLPVATGISGLCGGIAAFLAQSTSANLATAISDETGSGALVFGTSPTLTTPVISTITNSGTITLPTSTSTLATLALSETLSNKTLSGVTLGTPASGTLTNCTGLPVSSGISGLCGGIAAFLAQSTSANLATALSDETGSGSLVFANTPTLVTPNIGAATGTSLVLSAGLSANGGTFGTPTQLVGTNITGTASGLTAGNVTTNANLTGAITSNGNATVLGTSSFSSANLLSALSDKTGSGLNVFGTSPTISNSLIAGGVSFDLLNTTATTVNFAGAATTLNLGAAGGTATFAGSVIVNGDFTVQGNTTTLNTSTLNVEDFNITMGLTLTSAALSTGAGIAIGVGTGISFAYDHSTSAGWLSSVNIDLASAKEYRIGGTRVLNSSALGAGVTGSSLTQVGIITGGTWNGSAITDTYLAQITTGGKVANSATTATSLNTASTIVARDALGGFTAGTINAALIGNASTATSATTATNATNITVASETSDSTCFITFVTDSTPGNLPAKVNSTLTYNAASGELSATLIDGGTF